MRAGSSTSTARDSPSQRSQQEVQHNQPAAENANARTRAMGVTLRLAQTQSEPQEDEEPVFSV